MIFVPSEWKGCRHTKRSRSIGPQNLFCFVVCVVALAGKSLVSLGGHAMGNGVNKERHNYPPLLLLLRSHSSSRLAWPTNDDPGYTVFPVVFHFQGSLHSLFRIWDLQSSNTQCKLGSKIFPRGQWRTRDRATKIKNEEKINLGEVPPTFRHHSYGRRL